MGGNDYYFHGPSAWMFPLGNLQLLGKLQAGMLTANKPLIPRFGLKAFADRSVDWWVMSEDLPKPENRVVVDISVRITVHWTPPNRQAHHRLIEAATTMMKRAGY